MNKNPYEFKDEPWIISEVKETIVRVLNVFLEKQAQFIRAKNKTEHYTIARTDYCAALFSYYSVTMKGFLDYLKKNKEFLNKQGLYFPENNFIQLQWENQLEDETLLKMGYILNRWNFTLGHFKVQHRVKTYEDPVDQLVEENEV